MFGTVFLLDEVSPNANGEVELVRCGQEMVRDCQV
ncbi:hypothetical protein J2Y45_000932 [Dyadobacter sp. BE34]|uniref:Uncharacterized protein n=1 Tax=Dyadobacter fermentans TaxID=94254 RepID=A0ABU1QRB8_9BACT|nr:hypothetical protein [Dyadobacter fermentans]MDR7041402.1 hypothetical protein [Dyadobacter sp. BE242]MDR7195806.1 hypothetical protein [Dyadobacter sp. BE34]MDR7213650.1 hypothetical protein [Dyadobacter sp. BE31]MDR7261212.1 hypothetical protein [Dyadobacter sp. BE32]